MKTQFARLFAGLTFVGLAGSALAEPSPYFLWNFKEQKPLGIDKSRIATFKELQTNAPQSARLVTPAPDLSTLGIAQADTEPLGLSGWSMARAPGADWQVAELENLVAAAGDAGTVEFVSPVFLDEKGDPLLVTRDILVRFLPEVSRDQSLGIVDAHMAGFVLDENFADTSNLYRVRSLSTDGFAVLNEANALAVLPQVKYAVPDLIMTGRTALVPNDPLYPQQWALNQANDFDLDAPEAWDITTGNPAVLVVVMDTGVQQDHPDLNLVTGMTFLAGEGSVNGGPGGGCDNHGTWVAGCVSARINNGLGVVGIAPGCRVASAYVFAVDDNCGPSGIAPTSGFLNALAWAQTIGARVTNTSLNIANVASLTDKYADTHAAGIVHFAATGNSGTAGLGYPASLSVVVAVGATNISGNRAGFSTYGSGIDLVAPGENVATTDRTGSPGAPGDYNLGVSGTSFATPYAAGVAALMLSVDPTLTSAEVQFIMQQTAVDRDTPGYDLEYGYGIVNARAALNWVVNPPASPGSFNLTNPPQDAAGVSRNPLFAWSPATSVVDYEITVDDNPQFVNPEIDTTSVGNNLPSPATLEPGRVYYWSVTARNLVGSTPSNPLLGSFRTISDCNNNGIDDAADIAAGTPDCNANGIPDSCDIAAGNFRHKTVDYTPIEAATPQALLVNNVPPANGAVSLEFNALSDLNTSSEFFSISVGGTPVGNVFVAGGTDCAPSAAETLSVPAATWNAARLTNSVTISVTPSAGVLLPGTCPFTSYVNVTITYAAAAFSADVNQNGVPDECATACVCGDSNCDGQITVSDIGFFVTAVSQGQSAWAAQFPGGNPPCGFLCANDVNGDNAVTVSDIGGFVQAVTGGGCR